MRTKSRSLLLSRILVWMFIAVLVLGFILLPSLLHSLYESDVPGRSGEASDAYRAPQIVAHFILCLRLCVLPSLLALLCLHRLLGNINKDSVFINGNVKLIRIVSWCCFAVTIILIYLGIRCRYDSAFIMACLMAFIGLISRVVKNVFAQAIIIKVENDLIV